MKKEELKNKFIEEYLKGKPMQQIADESQCSRSYVGNLIRDDERVKEYKRPYRSKFSKIKVYKYRNQHRMRIPVSGAILEKIGVSSEFEVTDYVDLELDEENKMIIIRKHKED